METSEVTIAFVPGSERSSCRINDGMPTPDVPRLCHWRFKNRTGVGPARRKSGALRAPDRVARILPDHIIQTAIQTAMQIMMRFSVSETKPSGTFEFPPTQAHFNSRRSM